MAYRRCLFPLRCFPVLGAILLASSALAQTARSSLLEQSPAAPVIDLASGKLTIHAANSSLRAILDDLQTRTGTTIQGLGRDERIFGVYGPGNPQEVLAALLDDSGYNVLISGRKEDGSPREVVLSVRAVMATGGPAAQPGTGTQASDENDDGDNAPESTPVPQPALFAPPPQQGQPNQPGAASQQPIRTPQQMLEELQRMRSNPNAGQTAPPQ
jgi:hypothetical protein